MGSTHDHERNDEVAEIIRPRSIHPAIGQGDEIDSGLNDAEEQGLCREELLSTEAVQRLHQQVGPRLDQTRPYSLEETAQCTFSNVRSLESRDADVLQLGAFSQVETVGFRVCP